ncbi:MAG: hypothetical protein KDC93_00745 [Cyclobacteriaceae bacterium]|nr:hypothetical protein [Cyclobacteriaceae bacterium]
MRLAQLARKIGVKPSEIATFLANKNLPIEDSSNAKVADDQLEIVLLEYAPSMLPSVEVGEPQEMAEEKTESTLVAERLDVPEDIGLAETDEPGEIIIEENDETTKEVIKPVLVELPGLKVVGKIDLPEPKKKEEENSKDSEEKLPVKETIERPRRRNVSRENERRPRKNSVVLQREREAREALKRKQEEKEREKELRTQRYLKKVKNYTPPPQPIKRKKHEEEYEVYTEEPEKPKSLIGKILNWFVSE